MEHFSGERRYSGRREPRRKRRGEGFGAYGDEVEEARAELYCEQVEELRLAREGKEG